MRKRHQELAPRRTSSRISHKRQQDFESVEYAESLQREEEELEFCREQEEAEDREAQECSRRYLQKQKAIQDRLERAKARNDRLEDVSSDNEDVKLLDKMQRVLKVVKLHKDAWPFLQPVDEKLAPSYHHIIKEPMDISTMEEKVCQRLYKHQMELENDFKKMVNNCEVYNGVGNVYTKMAFSLWRVFLKSVRKYFGETISWPRLRPSGCMYIANSINENHHIKIIIRSFPGDHNGGGTPKRHHKKKAKKKRKRPPGMKAIEALALAAEEALKNSNFEDDSSTNDQVSSEFPGLKISTTQSHPPSMLVKYSGGSNDSEESDSSFEGVRDSWKNAKRKSPRGVVANGDRWRDSGLNKTRDEGKQLVQTKSVPTAAARKMYVDSPKKQMDFSVFDFVDETPPQPRSSNKSNRQTSKQAKPAKPSAKVSPMPFSATRRRLSSSSGKDKQSLEWNLLKPLTLQIPPIPSPQAKALNFSFTSQAEELTNSLCPPHLLDVSSSLYSNSFFAQSAKYPPCYNTGLHQHAVKL